jgi:ribonuclease P protein component
VADDLQRPPADLRCRFRPKQRVLRPGDFQLAYRTGRRCGNELFAATIRLNEHGIPRLGLSVAARTIGNAVARNRLKRLVRESFRLSQHRLPNADILIGARPQARDAGAPELRLGLERLWKKILAECAR